MSNQASSILDFICSVGASSWSSWTVCWTGIPLKRQNHTFSTSKAEASRSPLLVSRRGTTSARAPRTRTGTEDLVGRHVLRSGGSRLRSKVRDLALEANPEIDCATIIRTTGRLGDPMRGRPSRGIVLLRHFQGNTGGTRISKFASSSHQSNPSARRGIAEP